MKITKANIWRLKATIEDWKVAATTNEVLIEYTNLGGRSGVLNPKDLVKMPVETLDKLSRQIAKACFESKGELSRDGKSNPIDPKLLRNFKIVNSLYLDKKAQKEKEELALKEEKAKKEELIELKEARAKAKTKKLSKQSVEELEARIAELEA